MKKTLHILFFLTFSMFAQSPQKNFKEEMIKSGEKQVFEEVYTEKNEFKEFVKAKAWNRSEEGVFSNTAELDMQGIGGRVRAVLVDSENNIALAAPSGGGLWRFNPVDGSYFEPINDFGSFMAITDITQNPFNKQHIIVATGDEIHRVNSSGIFESFDGGNTFSEIDINVSFDTIRFIKFSPDDINVLYLVSNGDLYKSIDSGKVWERVFSSDDENLRIKSLSFAKNGRVLFTLNGRGVYASPSGDNDTFSVVTNGIVWRDSGANSSSVNYMVLATHATNRDIAYVLHAYADPSKTKEIYKTENGGISWIKLSVEPNVYTGRQAGFCLTIGVHPTNPNIVVLGGVGWAYTTDGGSTWNKGLGLEVDFHSVSCDINRPNVLYLGYDQGIGRVDFDNYENIIDWSIPAYVSQPAQLELGKKKGFNTTQIYYGDYFPEQYGDSYIHGQQDGGCFRSLLNKTDKRVVVGDGGAIFINKQEPNKSFVSTQNGVVYKTSNGLNNDVDYDKVTSYDTTEHPHFITQFSGNNADGNQLYIANKSDILMTKDGGDSFTSIATHNFFNAAIVQTEHAENPVVYAAATEGNPTYYEGKIIRINNAITSPEITSYSLNSKKYYNFDRINIDTNDRNTIYITTTRGEAYKISKLNTASPEEKNIKGDLPDVVFNTVIAVKDKPNMLIAGTNIGLFYSKNAGDNWILSNEIPYTQIKDLKLRESDMRLFTFTYGRGAWATTIKNDETLGANNEDLFRVKVYPNPVTETLYINVKNNTKIKAILYDSNGKEQARSVSNKINITHLARGLYIVHVLKENKLLAVEKIMIK